MLTITSVVNKGGAGKTTTSIALLDKLSAMGFKCLGVDLDAQGNLSHTAAVTHFTASSSDLFLSKTAYPIYKSRGFDLVPADRSLQELEKKIFSKYNAHTLLKQGLARYADKYDVCVIDCSSHIDMIAQNALVASDLVVCPILPEGWSFDGFAAIENEIQKIKESGLNNRIEIAGIIIHKFHSNYVIHNAIYEDFKRRSYPVYTVQERLTVSEAQYECRSLFEYDPKGAATLQLNEIIIKIANKYLKPNYQSNGKEL